jgi:hypothetical protein
MEKQITRWELIGILLIFGFGTTLHFWFAWTGYWRPIAVIAAVNESTWEHFKMAFWPGLILAIVEYFVWGRNRRTFFVAKFLGLLTMPVITMILFYGYTAIWHHSLPVDIAVFFVSVAGGQLISLYILRKDKVWPRFTKAVSIAGLVFLTGVFSTQSYFPRENFLFAHPESGEYGILSDYSDHDHDEDDY